MKKPEILAPTSTKASVTAALNGGCDAIYIGGSDFNARHYAENPSDNELKDIINICRLRGVKVFITLNILFKEDEIPSVLDFVGRVYEWGAYGLIIQDIGVANIIKKHFPNIKISASTQMTVYSPEGIELLKELGFDRVVLARELSLDEIKNICAHKGSLETEVFVHGALCVCWSGRCLMSSVIGGRSGNRGRCAQPCRMEYSLYKENDLIKKGFLLSPKDISTVPLLKDIVRSGVDSLKIEGRMKSPEYVYRAVSAYRKYTDMAYSGGDFHTDENDIKELTQIFNRGGSSSQGYLNSFSSEKMMSTLSPKSSGTKIGYVVSYNKKKNTCSIKLTQDTVPGDGIEIWSEPHWGTGISKRAYKGDIITVAAGKSNISVNDPVYRSYDKELDDRLKRACQKLTAQREIDVYVRACQGEPLTLSAEGITVKGDIGQVPENQPLSEEMIIARIGKTGDTPFKFNVKAHTDNVYFPVSALNSARRELCRLLEEKILAQGVGKSISIEHISPIPRKSDRITITALVRTREQMQACLEAGVKRIYSEISEDSLIEMCHSKGSEIYFALPFIGREKTYQQYIDYMEDTDWDGFLIRSLVKINTKKKIVTDHTLNVFNSLSLKAIREIYDTPYVTLSTELNTGELNKIADKDCEIIIYGRLPLMTTHQCPPGLYEAHKGSKKYCSLRHKKANYILKDRKNIKFPIIRDCNECIGLILNSSPIYAINKRDVLDIGAGFMRMEFTTENYDQALSIAKEHISVAKGYPPSLVLENTTGGHFHRGVM